MEENRNPRLVRGICGPLNARTAAGSSVREGGEPDAGCVGLAQAQPATPATILVIDIENTVIGIGAAVSRRPLPHHRAYGSVHGGSRRLR